MSRALSMSRRFLVVIALSIVFNILFSLGLMFFSGTFERIKLETYEEFATRITKKADHLTLALDQYATSAIIMANNLDQRVETLAARFYTPVSDLHRDKDLSRTVLSYALSSMVLGFDAHPVSGAFFILLDGERGKQQGIYLRASNFKGGQGFFYQRGPGSLADMADLMMPPDWEEGIDLFKDGRAPRFYEEILGMEHRGNMAFREDGYWSSPNDFFNDGVQSISYTIPLINQLNEVYAILGILLDTSFVADTLLPISSDDRFTTVYYMAPAKLLNDAVDWSIAKDRLHTSSGTDVIQEIPTALYSLQGGHASVAEFNIGIDGKKASYASVFKDLGLGSLTTNPEENWALIGFAKRGSVLKSYNSAVVQIAGSIVVAVLVAAFLIFVIAKKYIDKVAMVGGQVLLQNLESGPIHIDKTDIVEIDRLADALTEMQQSAMESTYRVTAILDMLKMPIGCFEVREKGLPRVFVTPAVKKILNIDDAGDGMYVDLERWNDLYATLTSNPVNLDEGIYAWHYSKDGEDTLRYINLDEVHNDDSIIGILTDVTEHFEKNMELQQQACFDSLTGLYNRSFFKQKVVEKIRSAPEATGLMLFGDLDGLKRVNDVYGHAMGDKLIITAGDMISTLEGLGAITSRLSGDEFAAYIHDEGSRDEILKRLLSHMERHFNRTIDLTETARSPLSISRGIAFYPDDSNDFSTLLSFADFAMYRAKQNKKGSINIFSLEDFLNDEVHKRKNAAMQKVLDEHLMKYAFQPIYDVAKGRVSGYAAYMRPQLPELTDPAAMLDLAIIADKHTQLEEMIFKDILTWIRDNDIPRDIVICVKTIKNHALDIGILQGFLDEFKDLFKQLVVMIPADSELNNAVTECNVRFFREAGSRIALDGFGEHFNESLEMLKLEPDIVKVRMPIIRDAGAYACAEDQPTLHDIIKACAARNIAMLAMEVETEHDYEEAKRLGFQLAQGYYVGYPAETLSQPTWGSERLK